MTKPNDAIIPELTYEQRGGDVFHYTEGGLTKREYFAAMAMQGMYAADKTASVEAVSIGAVFAADALIAELNKPKPPKETDNE